MRFRSIVGNLDEEIKETMEIEDEDFAGLSKIAGKPKAKEKFGKFQSVYIEVFKPKENVPEFESSSSSGVTSSEDIEDEDSDSIENMLYPTKINVIKIGDSDTLSSNNPFASNQSSMKDIHALQDYVKKNNK